MPQGMELCTIKIHILINHLVADNFYLLKIYYFGKI